MNVMAVEARFQGTAGTAFRYSCGEYSSGGTAPYGPVHFDGDTHLDLRILPFTLPAPITAITNIGLLVTLLTGAGDLVNVEFDVGTEMVLYGKST
ncbi:hypothetical protein D3C87_1997720 [compost metagenome]